MAKRDIIKNYSKEDAKKLVGKMQSIVDKDKLKKKK